MKFYLILIAILPFLCSCRPLSKEAQVSYSVLGNFAAQQKREKNLALSGIGASIPDKVRGLDLEFSSHKKLNIVQARKLFVTVSWEFLQTINSAAALRPYLHHYPVVIEDLNLAIDFLDDDSQFVAPPYIAYVMLVKGNIHYITADPQTHRLEDDSFSESYQSALELVRCK